MPGNPGLRRPRVPLIDALRGVAILAMVVFHVGWDLYYLGFTQLDVTNEPAWVAFQRGIVGAFLLLVGASLVLGHGDGIRWRPFWRRLAVILGAALLTSIGTYFVLPDYFVYFGILHAIALFSLMGLAFVRLPAWVAGMGALLFLIPPAFIADPVMMQRPLSWIGFWPFPPPTTDIVPVFPWFGAVLIGIAGMQLLLRSPAWPVIAGWRLRGPVGQGLSWMGRWSLIIYLVHQPLLYGGLNLIPRPAPPDEIGFLRQCETTCQAGGAEAGYCARYCSCALDQVTADNLWATVASPSRTAEQELALGAMTRLCEAMAR